jgi:hypothetical protein
MITTANQVKKVNWIAKIGNSVLSAQMTTMGPIAINTIRSMIINTIVASLFITIP